MLQVINRNGVQPWPAIAATASAVKWCIRDRWRFLLWHRSSCSRISIWRRRSLLMASHDVDNMKTRTRDDVASEGLL